jgi:hypothetical protein
LFIFLLKRQIDIFSNVRIENFAAAAENFRTYPPAPAFCEAEARA